MLNKVVIEGNLVADPETRTVGDNTVTTFRLASTRVFRGHNKERKTRSTFIDCTAWNGTGQSLSKSFHKGDAITLEGRIEYDEWETEGRKHSRVYIDIMEFHFPRGHRPRGETTEEAVAVG